MSSQLCVGSASHCLLTLRGNMTRVATKSRAAKQLKDNKQSSEVKRPQAHDQTKKTNKDGWEMSAQEALLVNFVVSEI